jgi:uncharacterized protein
MAIQLHRAERFVDRLGGLLARPRLAAGEALLLRPCNSVHTCFMPYAIDVVFLDRQGRVLRTVVALRPWRAAFHGRAHKVLEWATCKAGVHFLLPGRQTSLALGSLSSTLSVL